MQIESTITIMKQFFLFIYRILVIAFLIAILVEINLMENMCYIAIK